jgi:hypothetical protein
MHNFGEKRWGVGIVDDIRSQNDQNTRIVGDFTKMVRSAPIAQRMFKSMSEDPDWTSHFDNLVLNSPFPELNEFDPVVPKLIEGAGVKILNTSVVKPCRHASSDGDTLPRSYKRVIGGRSPAEALRL